MILQILPQSPLKTNYFYYNFFFYFSIFSINFLTIINLIFQYQKMTTNEDKSNKEVFLTINNNNPQKIKNQTSTSIKNKPKKTLIT